MFDLGGLLKQFTARIEQHIFLFLDLCERMGKFILNLPNYLGGIKFNLNMDALMSGNIIGVEGVTEQGVARNEGEQILIMVSGAHKVFVIDYESSFILWERYFLDGEIRNVYTLDSPDGQYLYVQIVCPNFQSKIYT